MRKGKWRTYTISDIVLLRDKAWRYHASATTSKADNERYQVVMHVIDVLESGQYASMALPAAW